MGVSFCKCKFPVFFYFPCIHKLKDDRLISSQPQPQPQPKPQFDKVDSLEEKPLDEEEVVNCEKEAVILKSCLKKYGCPELNGVEKRNVKWMDLVGKELVEIREFERMDLEEEERDGGNPPCLWFTQ